MFQSKMAKFCFRCSCFRLVVTKGDLCWFSHFKASCVEDYNYLWLHVATLNYFLSKSHILAPRNNMHPIFNYIIRTESIATDVTWLHDNVLQNRSRRDCQLPRFHEYVPDELSDLKQKISMLLHQEPQLIQRVCRIYVQDFACFAYKLPRPCNDILKSNT